MIYKNLMCIPTQKKSFKMPQLHTICPVITFIGILSVFIYSNN